MHALSTGSRTERFTTSEFFRRCQGRGGGETVSSALARLESCPTLSVPCLRRVGAPHARRSLPILSKKLNFCACVATPVCAVSAPGMSVPCDPREIATRLTHAGLACRLLVRLCSASAQVTCAFSCALRAADDSPRQVSCTRWRRPANARGQSGIGTPRQVRGAQGSKPRRCAPEERWRDECWGRRVLEW